MMPTKRQHCSQCSRPLNTCLCKHVQVVRNGIELIILQHPIEATETKNTARLLHLCLNNSQLHIGEQFDDAFFAQLNSRYAADKIYDILLYPMMPEERSLGISPPPLLDKSKLNSCTSSRHFVIRLWVLDATWRKSRKMLYLNPTLQRMARLPLEECPASSYHIRKAHNENQLSTLEASCYALQQLEQQTVNYTPVLQAFDAFIAEQKTFIPIHHLPMEPL